MDSPQVTVVAPAIFLGEGPHWDAQRSSLFYVNVLDNEVRRLRMGSTSSPYEAVLKLERMASFIIPVKNHPDKFVIGQERDIVLLTWDGRSSKHSGLEVIATVDTEDERKVNKINDGKADHQGRVWTGTFGRFNGLDDYDPHRGCIYSLRPGREIKRHWEGISLSNGLEWSVDGKTLYYIDSSGYTVDAFDFDGQNGEISNRRTVFDFKAKDVKGVPDGMTIDSDGKLWVACYSGSQVVRIDPESGQLLKALPVPSPNVTSVAWGGERYQDLYITSAHRGLSAEERVAMPGAGATFRVTGLGISGLPGREAVL